MNRLVSAFLIGGVFGLGITVSGMINPAKVLNFFDIAGTWDPSLIFVMGGGLAIAFAGYRLVFRRRKAPVFETAFALPTKRAIDVELVGGAASIYGPVIAAVVLTVGSEQLAALGVVRYMIIAVLIVLTLRFLPGGVSTLWRSGWLNVAAKPPLAYTHDGGEMEKAP